MNFNLLLSNTPRSIFYFESLIKKKLFPNNIILYGNKNSAIIKKKANIYNINYIFIKCGSINSKKLTKKIFQTKIGYFIYSGYPGEIVKSKLLNLNLIHAHPGKLPNFKGSTTLYYSIILTKKITCSVIRISKKIDDGQILFSKSFSLPKNMKKLENKYDYKVRAEAIIAFLKSSQKKYKTKSKLIYSNYYVAHPIIRQIVFDKNKLLYV
jgi:methionyl-tRNA formyltransferase